MTSGSEECLQILYIFVPRAGKNTFDGKVVETLARNTNIPRVSQKKVSVFDYIYQKN